MIADRRDIFCGVEQSEKHVNVLVTSASKIWLTPVFIPRPGGFFILIDGARGQPSN